MLMAMSRWDKGNLLMAQ